jgi:hypothetical protein
MKSPAEVLDTYYFSERQVSLWACRSVYVPITDVADRDRAEPCQPPRPNLPRHAKLERVQARSGGDYFVERSGQEVKSPCLEERERTQIANIAQNLLYRANADAKCNVFSGCSVSSRCQVSVCRAKAMSVAALSSGIRRAEMRVVTHQAELSNLAQRRGDLLPVLASKFFLAQRMCQE